MKAVEKALWFIEANPVVALTLDDVARHAGLSRFYLARAFEAATGYPVMRYVRARRLTAAAHALAAGAPDILAVALDAGYASHEAFTRAFRDHFAMTPEAVRARASLADLKLLEAIDMTTPTALPPQQPHLVHAPLMLVAGIGQRFTMASIAGIPQIWDRFGPHIGHMPDEVAGVAWGVCANNDDDGSFDYIAGVEVRSFDGVAAEFSRIRVPAQRYAIFRHDDHIATIRATMAAIWQDWLPAAGLTPADAPCLERYDRRFDGRTGLGGMEIWVPVVS